jgi:hypothetical protein
MRTPRSFLLAAVLTAVVPATVTAGIADQQTGWPTQPPAAAPVKKPAPEKTSAAAAAPETAAPATATSATAAPASTAPVTPPSAVATHPADVTTDAPWAKPFAEFERLLQEQARMLEAQQQLISSLTARIAPPAPTAAAATAAAPVAAAPVSAPPPAPKAVATAPQAPTPAAPPAAPATFALVLGGFLDAASVTRSTNAGSGLGTSFGSIPFANTAAGSLPETRLSAQNSRLIVSATSKLGGLTVKGYAEGDFLGQGPTSQFVTSNAATFRMRVAWAQVTDGTVEFLSGQSWSFLTPNRTGLSPVPSDIFFSQNVDTNYQSGLTWGRTNQFRVVFHPSATVAAGVSFENPEQYVGSAVTLPSAFAAAEVDNGSNTATPNPYPDVIAKVAFDPKTGATHQHLEFAALVRGFRTLDPATSVKASATGTGAAFGANVEPIKNLHLVANGFFAKGGGRYIANTNTPDFIVTADSRPSLVTARSVLGGAEWQASPRTLVYGYYSDVHADANVDIDTNGKAIGFGLAGASSANQHITESTFGLTRVFFKDAVRGALQLMAQYSFVERTPFSVPSGSPATASAHMVWVNIRYALPNATLATTTAAPNPVPVKPAPADAAKAPKDSKDSDDSDVISPDRPGFGEGADVVAPGDMEMETGVTFGGGDAGVRSLSLPDGLVRVGVTSGVEARIGADGFLLARDGSVRRTGYSDLEASLKVRLLDQRGAGLDVAIVPAVSLPTGAPGFTSGGVDPSVKVALGRALPRGWTFSANALVGSTSTASGRSVDRAASVSAAHGIGGGWNGFIETYGIASGSPETAATVALDWGATRTLGANLCLDVEAGRALTAGDWFVGFGFSARRHAARRR